MKKFDWLFLSVLLLFASCGEYEKILKSNDYELKYKTAKEYYETKKYRKAATLLAEITPIFKGTERAEETLYMLSHCYLNDKDYISAAYNFTNYFQSYPRGKYAEKARFYAAESYFMDSPDARLDQTGTQKALEAFQLFVEYYPHSQMRAEAEKKIEQLDSKLAYKEFLNSQLYYNLGSYLGINHYLSCIITANNAMKDHPGNSYKEEFMWLIFLSRYEMAKQSTPEKRSDRYREFIDEYYNFINEYPESKNIKKAKTLLDAAERYINHKKINIEKE